jgi:hypothetical protein
MYAGQAGDKWYENGFCGQFAAKNIFNIFSRVARWFVFKPKNPNVGKFWRFLLWKILVFL